MKKTTSMLYSQLGSAAIKILTNVVDETLATDFDHSYQKRIFSSVDLWHIQRNKKSLQPRRYL
ncbi:hypothetical protein BH11BAC3_BH11BAC3_03890 [soil metagenome]